jgi:hypothetical protein
MSVDACAPMRKCTLPVLMMLVFGATSAHAESHINLSCSHGRALKKTTLEDGHVRTEKQEVAAAFLIDVDLEHKTINGVYDAPYGQRVEDGSVSIGGYASKSVSEHEPGYQDTISIDRLAGKTTVTHLYLPAGDCAAQHDKVSACRMFVTTTVYDCLPAMTDFPTPIPKMIHAWEIMHRYLRLARMKQMMRHWYTSAKQRFWRIEAEELGLLR